MPGVPRSRRALMATVRRLTLTAPRERSRPRGEGAETSPGRCAGPSRPGRGAARGRETPATGGFACQARTIPQTSPARRRIVRQSYEPAYRPGVRGLPGVLPAGPAVLRWATSCVSQVAPLAGPAEVSEGLSGFRPLCCRRPSVVGGARQRLGSRGRRDGDGASRPHGLRAVGLTARTSLLSFASRSGAGAAAATRSRTRRCRGLDMLEDSDHAHD
jgi:hypothetical protein